MKRISPERKTSVLAKLLPPYNMTVAAVAQMEGISEATLYNWRNQAKTEGKPVPGAEKNSEQWPVRSAARRYRGNRHAKRNGNRRILSQKGALSRADSPMETGFFAGSFH